jgi:biotin carboxyl carrier protein
MKNLLKEILDRFQSSKANYLKVDLGWRKYLEFEKKGAGTISEAPAVTLPGGAVADTESSPQDGLDLVSLYVGKFKSIKENLKPGEKVRKGEILGSIQSMGITHEIVSPVQGVLAEANVNDTDIVEYDQVLFRIKEEK